MSASTESTGPNDRFTGQGAPHTAAMDPAVASASRASAGAPRIISGIDLVDYGAGGLYPEKVYVVKGGIGTGKSVLGMQFLTRGLELGEPGVLITDQKPEAILTQAKAIGFQIEEAVQRGQLTILNPSNRYFELVESPADVMAIVEELAEYVQKVGARRMVIDPIYTLVNTSYSSHFALSITQSLINGLEELPTTTLLIAGDEENAELNPIIRMLEQNSFGIISLSADPATGGRIMRLNKLRYASTDHLAAHYRILDGRGLINYRGEGEKVADVTKPWEEETALNRSVLILGANPDTIKKVKAALGETYKVSAEADLKAGVDRVRAENPGLVLVTPSSSMQSVSAILDLAQNSTSSIAFMSPTSNRSSDKVLYLKAGADDFLTEPFSPNELRARVDALIRRSGRRLNIRDTSISKISPQEITALLSSDASPAMKNQEMISIQNGKASLHPEFDEKLQRNLETISKLDMNFALYWIKSTNKDRELNKSLAQLCRQEDILCRNANGEFVAILTGTDENGVKGFETRLSEKIGNMLSGPNVKRGYALHTPGQSIDDISSRALSS